MKVDRGTVLLLDLVERRDASFKDLDIRLLDAAGLIVRGTFSRTVSLRKLIVNRLAID